MSCRRSVKAYKDKTRIYSNHPPAMTSSVTPTMTQSTSCFAGNYLEALPADLSELIMSYSKATWRYGCNYKNLFSVYDKDLAIKITDIMEKVEYKELRKGITPISSIEANNIFNKLIDELKVLAPDVIKYIKLYEYECDYDDYESDYDSSDDESGDEEIKRQNMEFLGTPIYEMGQPIPYPEDSDEDE